MNKRMVDDNGGKRVFSHRREFLTQSGAAIGLAALAPMYNALGAISGAAKSKGVREGGHPRDFPAAELMSAAANAFLDSLSAEKKAKATFSFDDAERVNWHFIPRPRKGIPLKELDSAQRALATGLLAAGLGQKGLIKATTIMSLDAVLAEIEQGKGPVRDPELYFVTILGAPASQASSQTPWGWRIEGHHLSLNYTLAGGVVASTPSFFGANPAEVRHGQRKGLRTLRGEEDLARTLLNALDDRQRSQAIISATAPSEILSNNVRKASALMPAGIAASSMSEQQAELLMSVLREYAANMPPDIAAARLDRIRSGGLGNLFFAWAGGPAVGQPHYYRIQTTSSLIEYDNTQNDANHIHTVWRDFNGDFGDDLLAEHYKSSHR
jgi:hypothetical protein